MLEAIYTIDSSNKDRSKITLMNDTSQRFERENVAVKQSLVTEHDVAEMLNVSVGTVRRWRLFDRGPRFLKIGASVRYRPEDVSDFLESRPTGGGNNTDGAEPRS